MVRRVTGLTSVAAGFAGVGPAGACTGRGDWIFAFRVGGAVPVSVGCRWLFSLLHFAVLTGFSASDFRAEGRDLFRGVMSTLLLRAVRKFVNF